jgi:hypothetical protein
MCIHAQYVSIEIPAGFVDHTLTHSADSRQTLQGSQSSTNVFGQGAKAKLFVYCRATSLSPLHPSLYGRCEFSDFSCWNKPWLSLTTPVCRFTSAPGAILPSSTLCTCQRVLTRAPVSLSTALGADTATCHSHVHVEGKDEAPSGISLDTQVRSWQVRRPHVLFCCHVVSTFGSTSEKAYSMFV